MPSICPGWLLCHNCLDEHLVFFGELQSHLSKFHYIIRKTWEADKQHEMLGQTFSHERLTFTN